MSAVRINQVCEDYIRRRAMRHLEKGRVTIFAAGTGNPFFTTDTAASLRAIEIEADLLLKATKVDGIYDADPGQEPAGAGATSGCTYDQVLDQRLNVMDATAIVLCRDHHLPLRVFNLNEPGALVRAARGEDVGTLVTTLSGARRPPEDRMLEDIKKDAAERMGKCVAAYRNELKRLRTGRASTSLVDHIRVEYYGAESPLQQVANVAVEDARTLTIVPWDKPMVAGDREGDHEVRSRPHAEHRRHGDPRAAAGADRGAAPRPHQGRASTRPRTRASRSATCAAT